MPTDTAEQQGARAPEFDRSLEVRSMTCPLPLLKTTAELARMQTGAVLTVT